jgi:long-chain acyl-CoA synthetase
VKAKKWQRCYDCNVPTTICYPRFPVQNFLHIAAVKFPHKPAINLYNTELTFAELRLRMLRLANALIQFGVRKGDRIGLAMPNCPQYIISYYAVISTGAVVVNINPFYTRDELKFMMEDTGMETLITIDSALIVVRPLAKELGLKHVIVTRLTDFIKEFETSTAKSLDLEEGWHHFSNLIESCSDTRPPRVIINPGDPALIQFTGGTTGLPKGAVLTHGNIVASTVQFSLWSNPLIGSTPYEKRSLIGVLPYFQIYGNIICMNWSILNAATQILFPHFEVNEFMDMATKFEDVTFFPTGPTVIAAIINHPKACDLTIDGPIRWIHSGGAPMPLELIHKVQDMGVFYNEGWGMTETTSMGICNPVLGNKAGSIGVPVMDNDVRIVDLENGETDVRPGEPGEIIIKSPTIMQGYWNNPTEGADQMKDGWLHTGDIAQTDEDGYFYIVDRKKDMIITGGFTVYPREVDEVLYCHPMVADAVTIGIPDPRESEMVKSFVELNPGDTATEKEIIDFCETRLAPYKVPKMVEFLDSIPKSAVGKILRKILRDEEVAKSK